MKGRLLNVIREAFPHALVTMYFDSEYGKRVFKLRTGSITLTYIPEPEIWDMPYDPNVARKIIGDIQSNMTFDVDPFYEPTLIDKGSTRI